MKAIKNNLFNKLMKNVDWNKLMNNLKALPALYSSNGATNARFINSCSLTLQGPYKLLCQELSHDVRRFLQFDSCKDCWFTHYCKGHGTLLDICAAHCRNDHRSVQFILLKKGRPLSSYQIAKR